VEERRNGGRRVKVVHDDRQGADGDDRHCISAALLDTSVCVCVCVCCGGSSLCCGPHKARLSTQIYTVQLICCTPVTLKNEVFIELENMPSLSLTVCVRSIFNT